MTEEELQKVIKQYVVKQETASKRDERIRKESHDRARKKREEEAKKKKEEEENKKKQEKARRRHEANLRRVSGIHQQLEQAIDEFEEAPFFSYDLKDRMIQAREKQAEFKKKVMTEQAAKKKEEEQEKKRKEAEN
jgi:hypothetical protein